MAVVVKGRNGGHVNGLCLANGNLRRLWVGRTQRISRTFYYRVCLNLCNFVVYACGPFQDSSPPNIIP